MFVMVLAVAAGLSRAALAKDPPTTLPITIDALTVEATVARGPIQVGVVTGVPRTIYNVSYAVTPAEPEIMARQYLKENRGILRLSDPMLADLSVRATRRGLAGTTVRFEQTFQGIPVLVPDIAVTIDRASRVMYVTNGYAPGVAVASTTPSVSLASARATAIAHLNVSGTLASETSRLVVVPEDKGGRLAWQFKMVPQATPVGDWEVLVDAQTGVVFHAVDRALYAAGSGFVFDPDPLGTAHATYGQPGYSDAGDVTTAQLDAARSTRTLNDITDIGGGVYKLQGPWAQIVDFEAPAKGLFTQPSTTFNFDRAADAFEAVNCYFHIDHIMRHINLTLGIPLTPFQYVGGVRYDPSGLSGADNSHYIPSSGQMAFGEGGVDDAEDADVVIHELGHGIHDWLTSGSLSQVNGLSEGTGDYICQSYSRSLGQWASNEAPYNWTFSWDGHNEFWAGRITNYGALYPGGLTGAIHTDGQIWATCLMRIWNDIGRNQTDKAVFEGLAMTNSSTNQNDAAQAVLQAAVAMGYSNAEISAMASRMQATGYTVSVGVDYVASSFSDACPTDPGQNNGILEPGENADIIVNVKAATFARTGVSGVLTTSTPGVTIVDGNATWPDLQPGVSTPCDAPYFKVYLDPTVPCLSTVNFQLAISSNEGGPFPMAFTRTVGQAVAPAGLPLSIPDNAPAGATSTLTVGSNLTLTDVNVRVAITHTWVGDLVIKIKSPANTEVILLDRPGVPASQFGCGDNDMNVTFDDASGTVLEAFCSGSTPWFNGTAKPVGLLSAFNGQSTQGNWVLTVTDLAGQDVGSVTAWELITQPPLVGVCDTCQSLVGVPVPTRGSQVALGANHPNPFSLSTDISFELARPGRATLRIYDVAGQVVATLVDGELSAGPHTVRWDGRDQSRTQVASGVYFYKLSTGNDHGMRRMLVVH
jgi:subtilisin-like proprotein convertase family protein